MRYLCLLFLTWIFVAPHRPEKKTEFESAEKAVEELGIAAWAAKADDAAIAEKTRAIVDRFAKTALQEEQKFGIPAKITLAQAVLESGGGESFLAKNANNFFGVKCHKRGKRCKNPLHKSHVWRVDGKDGNSRFVVYPSAWASFRDHSLLLKQERYKPCFKSKDPAAWAYSLKKCGYATSNYYSEKLLQILQVL